MLFSSKRLHFLLQRERFMRLKISVRYSFYKTSVWVLGFFWGGWGGGRCRRKEIWSCPFLFSPIAWTKLLVAEEYWSLSSAEDTLLSYKSSQFIIGILQDLRKCPFLLVNMINWIWGFPLNSTYYIQRVLSKDNYIVLLLLLTVTLGDNNSFSWLPR